MGITALETPEKDSYWAQFMPTQAPVHCVDDIDYEQWVAEGVTTLFFDVEALGATGAQELNPDKLAAVSRSREAGIKNLGLMTNYVVKSKMGRNLLRGWAEQVGADLTLSPLESSGHKLSPVMLYKGMQYFDVAAKACGVSGDKATADIRAGYLAGIEHRAWTRPFGDNRHPGDRFARGPLEAILRLRAHLLLTPKPHESIDSDETQMNKMAVGSLARVTELFQSGQVDSEDDLMGFGTPNTELSDEILATLHQPVYRQALEAIKITYDTHGALPTNYLKDFLYENGRIIADGLVVLRLLCALGVEAINISGLPDDLKNKLSLVLVATGHITDIADGPSARAHKAGATKKGAADDHDVDKALSIITDLFPLMRRDLISKPDVAITIARDLGLTMLRKPFSERGIDTKSVWSGKGATLLKAAAQMSSLSLGSRYPVATRRVHTAATAAKLGSALHAPFIWVARHELEQHLQIDNDRQMRLTQLGTVTSINALKA